MSKYIDKGRVLEYIIFGVVGKEITCGELKRTMESLPTIDIVRCKDCKHWDDDSSKCTKWTTDTYEQAQTNADDFCSYGERIEE